MITQLVYMKYAITSIRKIYIEQINHEGSVSVIIIGITETHQTLNIVNTSNTKVMPVGE